MIKLTKPKRARPMKPRWGRCPDCLSVLALWAVNSRGHLDLYYELGCSHCQEIKFEQHAETCECHECKSGIPKCHRIQS